MRRNRYLACLLHDGGLGRIHEKQGTGVCNCRHLADAHEILFQTIYAIKRGKCTVEGCSCEAYVRNPNFRVVSQ